MKLKLNVWRQKNRTEAGRMTNYTVDHISEDMSFLEMMDMLNEDLIKKGEEPVAFEHDCREGICGSCSMMVNGQAHGPERGATTCQVHMRSFTDGETVVIEPWRAAAFPVIRDLIVDLSAFDRVIQSGGYVSVNTGGAEDANAIPVPKPDAERAMDSAACIGCGACVAACPNASAQLFVGAKVLQLALIPQGQPERRARALAMSAAAAADFGACSDVGACRDACPAGISLDVIASLNHEVLAATLRRSGPH